MGHRLTELKPDFEEARKRWEAFWQGEIIDRPLVAVTSRKDGSAGAPGPIYLEGVDGDLITPARRALNWASNIFWGGEAIPTYVPSFGPDQFAAFLGAELVSSPDSPGTNWVEPFVKSWSDVLPLTLEDSNHWWTRMVQFMEVLSREFDGRLVISHLDLHSNVDCLSAIRTPKLLCEDLMDIPETIDEAALSARRLYPEIYDGLFKAAKMDETGSSGWLTAYCEGRFNVIQCDFICMVSPNMARRWIIPALEEEASFLDHCIYHYDGPGALVHLNDILSIKGIDAIQWVPGDGQPPVSEWIDLLQKMQAAGKALYLDGSPDLIKWYHKQLKPEKVFYRCWAGSESEAKELLTWLTQNT